MNDTEFLQGLICVIRNHKEFSDEDIGFLNGIYQIINTKENGLNIERWITVKGNHIAITKGQTAEQAIKQFIKTKTNDINRKNKIKKVNPNYQLGGGYKNNCQICVAVEHARSQGKNVEALPYDENNQYMRKLASNPALAFIDKNTKKHPIMSSTNTKNIKELRNYLNKTIKPNEKYILGFYWKSKDDNGNNLRHVLTVFKESGTLKYSDGQNQKIGKLSDIENRIEFINYQRNGKNYTPQILRIDDKEIDDNLLKNISKSK